MQRTYESIESGASITLSCITKIDAQSVRLQSLSLDSRKGEVRRFLILECADLSALFLIPSAGPCQQKKSGDESPHSKVSLRWPGRGTWLASRTRVVCDKACGKRCRELPRPVRDFRHSHEA